MTGFLKIEKLSKAYSASRPVFSDVSFTLERGEFVCIIGHSGCGKTTILNVLAGLDEASSGHVFMEIHFLFSGFLFAFFIVIILYFTQENLFTSTELTLIPNIILAISHLIVFTYLLINPQVLTGLPFVKYTETPSSLVDNETVKIPFILENYAKEIRVLEHYFHTQKTYLQPNLSISQVAVETQIPNRDLSYIINNYYQKRFNDYLNEMRLAHFLSQIDSNTLDNLTIEAIAFDSGFSSKSSFYRAFNRFYGCTPSEYLETVKTSN